MANRKHYIGAGTKSQGKSDVVYSKQKVKNGSGKTTNGKNTARKACCK